MKNRKKVFAACMIVILVSVALSLLDLKMNRVEYIEIDQQSLELSVGEAVQLTVSCYDRSGDPAESKYVDALALEWIFSGDGAYTVDETGLLTAVAPGLGNVAVLADGEINSRAITVRIVE